MERAEYSIRKEMIREFLFKVEWGNVISVFQTVIGGPGPAFNGRHQETIAMHILV